MPEGSPAKCHSVEALEKLVMALLSERDKQYEQRFQAQKDALTTALSAAERALAKADTMLEKRLDAGNEIRQAMLDQQKLFLSRAEWDANHKALEDKVTTINTWISEHSGMERKGEQAGAWIQWAIGLIALGIITIGASWLTWMLTRSPTK